MSIEADARNARAVLRDNPPNINAFRRPELLVHLVSRRPYRYERFVLLPAIPPPGSLISSENEDDLPTFKVIGVSILAHTVNPEEYRDEPSDFDPAHILVTVEPV
jgi:hypothetical protein